MLECGEHHFAHLQYHLLGDLFANYSDMIYHHFKHILLVGCNLNVWHPLNFDVLQPLYSHFWTADHKV